MVRRIRRTKTMYCNANQALLIARNKGITITKPTLIIWIQRNKLGFQLGGRGSKWYLDKEKFTRFIQGERNSE